ncbi:MAG: D-sedoheptulose 7-phosphate isomerase [Bacillota bacterium]
MISLSLDESDVRSLIDAHIALAAELRRLVPKIAKAAKLVAEALGDRGKVLLCGNGGSAADAQHIAGELVGRFLRERRPLPALALNTNTSTLTALGNDYGFEEVFARQVAALGRPGDVLIAISTSGKSPNVVRAASAARKKGLKVIGLTGAGGGELKELCDLCLCIPSESTPRIQEMHILIGHIICELVEAALCCPR